MKRGDITLEEAEQALDDFGGRLQAALDETKEQAEEQAEAQTGPVLAPPPPEPRGVLRPADTAIDRDTANRIVDVLNSRPDGFAMHPKLAKQFDRRLGISPAHSEQPPVSEGCLEPQLVPELPADLLLFGEEPVGFVERFALNDKN